MPDDDATDTSPAEKKGYRPRFTPVEAAPEGQPIRKLAVVTCMDCRVEPRTMLGLRTAEAHIIRNAGGIITPDTERSLVLSQRALATEEIWVIHHTDCGLQKVDDEEFLAQLEEQVGERPVWRVGAFDDVEEAVRRAVGTLRSSPFLLHRDHIRGFVYHVESDEVREVTA